LIKTSFGYLDLHFLYGGFESSHASDGIC